MKNNTIKIVLIITLMLLTVCLFVGGALRLGLPWWAGLLVLICLLSLYLAFPFIKKWWVSRLATRKIKTEYMTNLASRWKDVIRNLKNSCLKQHGDPFYVLPWFLLVGESGSGKTTAIKNAHLSSTFLDSPEIANGPKNINCGWWFMEDSIVIDTTGRYAIGKDEARTKEEWNFLLKQLAKYRRKDPISGLVITISAEKLCNSNSEALEEEGKNIRRRVEELMYSLGVKPPIYIVVTKCDLIQGMTQFCEMLPESTFNQAKGQLNNDPSTGALSFLETAQQKIFERLKELRLVISSSMKSDSSSISALFFPEEFAKLKENLKAFFKGAFKENIYQEVLFLRGLYFASGRQEGSPCSYFLNLFKLVGTKLVTSGKGLFLHDFFSRILPKDKNLVAPTYKNLKRRQLIRRIAVASWMSFMALMTLVLVFSFSKNLTILRTIQSQFAAPMELSGDLSEDVNNLEHLRETIIQVEAQNDSWWTSGFGLLRQSAEIENRLKKRYNANIRKNFIIPYDKEMEKKILSFTVATQSEIIGQNVPHLVRRINLLNNQLNREDFDALKQRPQPDYQYFISPSGEKVIPEVLEMFETQYLYYLAWENPSILSAEKKNLESRLKYVASQEDISLNWLVEWCSNSSNLPAITLQEFWGGTKLAEKKAFVLSAYTIKGKETIDFLLKELEAALPEPILLAKRRTAFNKWYETAYLNSWYNFAESFSDGAGLLTDKDGMLAVVMKTPTEKGPYFVLLDRMYQELKPFISESEAPKEELPRWVKLLQEFDIVKKQAVENAARKKDMIGGAIAKTGGGLSRLWKFGKSVSDQKSKEAAQTSNFKSLMLSADSFNDYTKALTIITENFISPLSSFQMAQKVFGENPATSDTPVFAARKSADSMKLSMTNSLASEKVFWQLLYGPLNFLWKYSLMETGSYLQKQWEETVLSEVSGINNKQEVFKLLLGKEGYAVKFIEGPAKPFIGKDIQKGYFARSVLDEEVPFNNAFLSFLSKGSLSSKMMDSSYRVVVESLPSEINPESQTIPHLTSIELQCSAGVQSLKNYNYPINKTFYWNSQGCGDTSLKIDIGEVHLEKKFEGQKAFAMLLKELSNGAYVLRQSDFPDQSDALERLNISYIKVRFKLTGYEPVVDLLDASPTDVPRSIVVNLLPEAGGMFSPASNTEGQAEDNT